MKATLKRVLVLLCAAVVAVTAVQVPAEINAAPSAKTVKKAYISFLKKKIANCTYEEDIDYSLYDFNKDGIKELVVSCPGGARAICDIYTYRNKKVVSLVHGVNDVGYLKGKKYIVTYGSGGSRNFDYTLYKIKKGKAVQVHKYACVDGVYQKDGKNVDQSVYLAFDKKVVHNLGDLNKVPVKYYSAKNLGFSLASSSKKYTCVTKATNKKVYYYYYKLGDEQITTWQSKTKSAKITSKTKFYYGNKELFFSDKLRGKDGDKRKWIYRISKKQFVKKMKNYNETLDQIVVKNGKVVKVIIHIQIAG